MQWQDQLPDFRVRSSAELFRDFPLIQVIEVLSLGTTGNVVLLNSDVWEKVLSHLRSKGVELGGLLLGRVYEQLLDAERWVARIEACVAADDYDATGVSLRMSSRVWERARETDDRRDLTVIGWYHSHPNLGVFFSGTDRRTQRDFFREPHCLGLVVDPVRDQQKWFVGPTAEELAGNQVLLLPSTLLSCTQERRPITKPSPSLASSVSPVEKPLG